MNTAEKFLNWYSYRHSRQVRMLGGGTPRLIKIVLLLLKWSLLISIPIVVWAAYQSPIYLLFVLSPYLVLIVFLFYQRIKSRNTKEKKRFKSRYKIKKINDWLNEHGLDDIDKIRELILQLSIKMKEKADHRQWWNNAFALCVTLLLVSLVGFFSKIETTSVFPELRALWDELISLAILCLISRINDLPHSSKSIKSMICFLDEILEKKICAEK